MDVCKDFQDISDEMSSAEKRNIEDKDSAMSVAFEAGEPSSSITSIHVDETYECEDSETDLYLLDVSATIAEMEGEEIEEEFDVALVEIAGVKSFPCEQCDKVCRSKGGLTRHFNSKHGQVPAEQSLILKLFSFETVSSIVESIKTKVRRNYMVLKCVTLWKKRMRLKLCSMPCIRCLQLFVRRKTKTNWSNHFLLLSKDRVNYSTAKITRRQILS